MKNKPVSVATFEGLLKEYLSNFEDLTGRFEIKVFQAPDMPKITIQVRGNFQTVEDILDQAYEERTYASY